MEELEGDAMVVRWTRHHGIRVAYRKWWGGRGFYEPDFLVELVDGGKELREVKGEHLFADANTARKLRAGNDYCLCHGLVFRVVTKSPVDPALWAAGTSALVEQGLSPHRPQMGEALYVERGKGCLGRLLFLAGVLAGIVTFVHGLLR